MARGDDGKAVQVELGATVSSPPSGGDFYLHLSRADILNFRKEGEALVVEARSGVQTRIDGFFAGSADGNRLILLEGEGAFRTDFSGAFSQVGDGIVENLVVYVPLDRDSGALWLFLGGLAAAGAGALVADSGHDTQAPGSIAGTIASVTADSGIAGDFVTSDNQVVLAGTLDRVLGAGETVELSLDGGASWVATVVSGTGWSLDHQAVTLADGTYDLRLRVSDAAGNATALASRSLVIDTSVNTITGVSGDQLGFNTRNAGDVNGDGIADLIVGSFSAVGAPGHAYVIYGRPGGIGNINVSALTPAQGFRITGEGADDKLGFSVSYAGDVNGDGIDDVIVGADRNDSSGLDAGRAYVIYGRPGGGIGDINVSALTSAQGFRITGDVASSHLGFQVSSAGDINGDGIGDVLVGAYGRGPGGAAYVVYGRSDGGIGDINVSALTPTQGFRITGEGSQLGISASNAGDVNGDGIEDVIVGDYAYSSGGLNSGRAYVIYGRPGGIGDINVSALTPAQGFRITGEGSSQLGTSASNAGDVNGDGIGDVIVGAFSYSGNAGRAYVIYGRSGGGIGDINVSALTPAQGFRITGEVVGGYLGRHVSSAGDINGDGIGDVLVGAPQSSIGGFNRGRAYVVYGQLGGVGDIELSALTSAQGFRIDGQNAGDLAGNGTSNAGDVNGDGISDLMIGASSNFSGGFGTGRAYVIYGKVGFRPDINLATFVNPVAIDVNGDGAVSYGHSRIDLTGQGDVRNMAWVGSHDGVLVWDANNDGQVNGQSEFAFSLYGGNTDLEGLRHFDSNANDALDAGDDLFGQFHVWVDANGNGASDHGELLTLADVGITAIHLTSDGLPSDPAQGVHVYGNSWAARSDGSTMLVQDASFALAISQMDTNAAGPSADSAVGVVEALFGKAPLAAASNYPVGQEMLAGMDLPGVSMRWASPWDHMRHELAALQ